MAGAAEAAGVGRTPMGNVLDAGLDVISYDQEVTFTRYVKRILPADGYVFWLRTGKTTKVKGSLHYATDQAQREDETFGVNRVVFTAESPIEDFNSADENCLWIGCFEGLRFSFNGRKSYYRQATIHHYYGDAVYPALASQLIDKAADLDPTRVIVSNSLPIWLTLNKFFPMYPSFLVKENIEPVYCAVHVAPEATAALQMTPFLGSDSSHYQLATDRVRLTLYGGRNDVALDFQDYVNGYSLDTDLIGIMNVPIWRDEKRTQSELNVIAMKKTIEFQISYYQTRVQDVARKLIQTALISHFYIQQ